MVKDEHKKWWTDELTWSVCADRGHQLTVGQAVAAATARLTDAAQCIIVPQESSSILFFFSLPGNPGQGLHVPSVLMFQFDPPRARRHWAIVWVLLCKTGCSTTTTQQDWWGGETQTLPHPLDGRLSSSGEHLYSERNAAAVTVMSQHCVCEQRAARVLLLSRSEID